MIVVAIIGILAAVALPAHQGSTIRTKAAEGLSLAAPATLALTEAATRGDIFGATNATAAFSGDVVQSVTAVGTSAAGATPHTANITIIYKSAAENVPAALAEKKWL